MKNVFIEDLKLGNDLPLTLIAGPCQLESLEHTLMIADFMANACREANTGYIFKGSFDKANRTSLTGKRGVGVHEGLSILEAVKKEIGCPVLTDVHDVNQCELVGDLVDVIQIPAFLCRQTDLLIAAGNTGAVVNIKKGQFLSPLDFQNIINKFTSFQNDKLLICERGTSFGYNNLIVDMIGISTLKKFEYPVIFDVTHSLQQPGSLGGKSGGRASSALDLAKAAMSIGLAGLFLELHPNPEQALCDGPSALPLELLKPFLKQIMAIDSVVKGLPVMKI